MGKLSLVIIVFVVFSYSHQKELYYKIDWAGSVPKELDSKFLEDPLGEEVMYIYQLSQ